MLITSAKLIGAGIAITSMGGACIGLGIIFGMYLISLSRNPGLKSELFSTLILGFALVEASGLFSLLISLFIMFTK